MAAIVTATVSGSCTAIMIALLLVYDAWGLARIRKEHQKLKREAEQRRVLEVERGRTLQAAETE